MRFLRGKELALHPWAAPFMLVAAVIGVYYPAMLSGIHSIDDPGIISRYTTPTSLAQILLPGSGYYYRPMIELSFWLDHRLWELQPAAMHLENILLHAANSILVYVICATITRKLGGSRILVPLCAALVFAVHPLNVEAVAWIAGRTDPLLAFFGLSGTLFLIRWIDEPRWYFALPTIVSFILALFTKETAIALLPSALLLLLWWPHQADSLCRAQKLKICGATAVATLALGVLALAMSDKITALRRLIAPDVLASPKTAVDAVVALGFYLRKAFAPFPLNFAITEVSPMHALVAASGALILIAWLRHRHLAALFFAVAMLLITPALLVAVRNISWTPYAERYMYLPTAFISLGVGTMIASLDKKAQLRLAPVLVLIILAAFVSSRQRTALWQDKMAFYEDAVAKSPRFGSVYNELGVLYLQKNRLNDAARAFELAERLNKRPAMIYLIKSNIMNTMVARGDYARAREYFETLFPAKEDAPAGFLESLQRADGRRLPSLSGRERGRVSNEIIDTCGVLYLKTADPFWLYRSALLAGDLKSYPLALKLFRKAYAEAPADASYRLASGKQIARLERIQ